MPTGLIWEVSLSQDSIRMSLLERRQDIPSLKTISENKIDFSYLYKLCSQINNLLSQQNKTDSLKEEKAQELKKLGELLFDHLLSKKIKQRLREEPPQDLTLIIDEKLIFIPWEIIHTQDDFLCLKFNLSRSLITHKELENYPHPILNHPLKVLIIANPTEDLPLSYKEGLKLKNFLYRYQDLQIDFKANGVNTFYLKKNLRDYDIFHFAGHYELDSRDNLKSGLLLKDGRLTCEDLILLSQSRPLPRLAFVNACQSSFIDNWRSVYNLAYVFLLGGCQHYIGSFAKISDEIAIDFACSFYKEILKGSSVGYALRMARFELIKNYGLDAFVWANYILYGDAGYIILKPLSLKRTIFKRIVFKNKKRSLFLFSLLIGITLIISVLTYLNPSSYILFKKAVSEFNRGRNNEVFSILEKIIKKNPDYLSSYYLYADTYFRLGKLDEAIKYYFLYLRYAEKKKDYRSMACAYSKLGWTYHMKADYPKAEVFYQKAIDLSRKYNDKLNEADALSKLAIYYADKKDFQKALSLLIESSQINQERKNDPKFLFNLACDYFNLGFVFSELKDYAKAKEFYNKSRDIFLKLKAIPELSDYYFNMGELERFDKNYQKALDYYQKGLMYDKKLSHIFNLSSDYQMLAELYWEMGQMDLAEKYFKEAMSLCEEIQNLSVLAEIYYELGCFYKENKNPLEAKHYLKKAYSLYQKIGLPLPSDLEELISS